MNPPTNENVSLRPPPTHRRWLLGAVGLGAAVRLIMLVSRWHDELPLSDALWYSGQAQQIANGKGFEGPFVPGPSAEHGPLTPLLLAPVSGFTDPVGWQRLVLTIVGIATVALIGVLAARVAGWTVGVVAALLAAIYPNLWVNDTLVMSESLAALTVTAALLAAVSIPGSRRRSVTAASCGALVGLAALTRSELLLLVPLIALPVWRGDRHRSADDRPPSGDRRSAALIVIGAIVVVAPWVVRNLVSFERPVLMTTNEGATLLGANCDDSYYRPDIGGWSLWCVLDAGGPPDEEPSIRSARYRSLAFDHVADHTSRVPLVVAARIGRGLDLVGVQNLVDSDVAEGRYRWADWAGVVAWWLLVLPMVLGARMLDRRTRWILLAPAISVFATIAVFYGGHRIRAPLEPVVVVLAAVALVAWRARHSQAPLDDAIQT